MNIRTSDHDLKPRARLLLALVLGAAAIAALACLALFLRGGFTTYRRLAAIAIFIVTYAAVAIGRLPWLRIDRAGAAFAGAGLIVAAGVLPLKAAYDAIDFDTITLLLGVMVVVANLRLSGLLGFASGWMIERARHPMTLLVAVVVVSGVLSAFLVNDAICLAMTPLVMETALSARRNPVPYAMGVALASNIGSTATITGNPQNIIIGSISHIPYGRFAAALSPVAAIGLLLTIAVIAILYREEFRAERMTRVERRLSIRPNLPLMLKSGAVAIAMVAAFFAGVAPARAAIGAGAVLMLTRRVKSKRIFAEIDWPLLLMFAGLFIVVAGFEKTVLSANVIAMISRWHLERTAVLAAVTAVLSNVVSNVPAVMVLGPFVARLGNHEHGWLTVAMASTLAGNLTIPGSIANLIVVQRARAYGVEIGFREYLAAGAPLAILTIIIGVILLSR